MRRLNKTINYDAVEFITFIPHACKVSRQHFLYYCQTKRILIGGFALLLSVFAQGLDVRLAGMVSKAVVKMCRCFYTCWMTCFNNYASKPTRDTGCQ